MSPENFCYWLRGYIELNSENNPGLSPDQLKKVSEHLSLVLREVPKGWEVDPKFVSMYSTDPNNTVEISPGEGLKPVDFPLQIDPNIRCVLTC